MNKEILLIENKTTKVVVNDNLLVVESVSVVRIERQMKIVGTILIGPNKVKKFKSHYDEWSKGNDSPSFLFHSMKDIGYMGYSVNKEYIDTFGKEYFI